MTRPETLAVLQEMEQRLHAQAERSEAWSDYDSEASQMLRTSMKIQADALRAAQVALQAQTDIKALVLWLQGEKAAASRIVNGGGPIEAVMAATGLHSAYRATLAKIANYELPAPPDGQETP